MDVSNNSIRFLLDHNNIDLDIPSLPSISTKTKEVFDSESNIPTPSYVNYPLKERAETLKSTQTKLENAKSHTVRDKIFGVLRCALMVGLIVGGVLGTIALASFCPPAAALFAIGAYFACSFLAGYYADRIGLPTRESVHLLMHLIAGAAYPIYEEFGKVSRLEKKSEEQGRDLEDNIQKLSDFFASDLSELRQKLEQKIKETEESLTNLDKYNISTEAGKKEIEQRRSDYIKARDELDRAVDFYSQISF